MKVRWNAVEPPVPLNAKDDPEDYILEIVGNQGSSLTVKRTWINDAHEVGIIVNGRVKEGECNAVSVGRYTIRVANFERDEIAPKEVPILSHEVINNVVRLTVDAWL